MMDELAMLGLIGRSVTSFPKDPDAEFEWSFYKLFVGADDIKYKAERRLSNSLCCQSTCPIPIIHW